MSVWREDLTYRELKSHIEDDKIRIKRKEIELKEEKSSLKRCIKYLPILKNKEKIK